MGLMTHSDFVTTIGEAERIKASYVSELVAQSSHIPVFVTPVTPHARAYTILNEVDITL